MAIGFIILGIVVLFKVLLIGFGASLENDWVEKKS